MSYNLQLNRLYKHIVTTMVLLLLGTMAFSQNVIDSLILRIKHAKDTARVDVYNDIAYEYRNSDIEKTQFYADTAVMLAQKIDYTRGLGNAYINKGNYYKLIGESERARACYVWAYVQHQKIGNKQGISSTLNCIAGLHFLQGNLTKALTYFIQSLTISQEINDRRGEAITLNNIGVINLEQKNYGKALEYYERAFQTFKETNDKNNMADALNNMGNVYHTQGLSEEALRYYEMALEINNTIGNLKGQSSAINNMGLVNYENKDYKKALKYYHQSLSIDEKLNDKQAQTITCNNIAGCYYRLDMCFAAKKYALRSLQYAQEQQDKIDMMNSYDILARLEDKLGNYKEALVYYKSYNALSDSLYNEETRQQLENIEEKYAAEKAENERLIKALGKDQVAEVPIENISSGKGTQTLVIAAGAMTLLTIVVLWVKSRKQKPDNQSPN